MDAWLSYTLPANGFIDFLRVVTVVLGVNLALFSLVRLVQRKRRWSSVAFMVFGFVTALQEAQQMGERFLPWRLPLLLLGTLAGLRYMSYAVLPPWKTRPSDHA